jgi:hypothetical protein
VHLVNTTAIKKYDGLKHSGDETDARYLAHHTRLRAQPFGAVPELLNISELSVSNSS